MSTLTRTFDVHAGPMSGTCGHDTHDNEQFMACLAAAWGITVSELVAALSTLVADHVRREATKPAAPEVPAAPVQPRRCGWCRRTIPEDAHHNRRYCADSACQQLAVADRRRAHPRKVTP